MSRNIPFDPDAECDNCGKKGAFEFPYVFLCAECALRAETEDQDDERDGGDNDVRAV